MLSHVIGDKVEQDYRRDDALERRRPLMESWASFCESRGQGNSFAARCYRMMGKTHRLTLTAQDFQVLEEAAGFSLDDEARKEVATYIRYALTGLFASAEGLVLGDAERGGLSRYIGLLNRAHKVLENELARQLGVELTRIYQSKTEPDELVVITKFWLDIASGQQADQILAQLIEQANVTLRAAQATTRGQRYRAGEDALITLFRAVHKRAKKRNNSRGQKIAGQNGDAFVGAINDFLDREGRRRDRP